MKGHNKVKKMVRICGLYKAKTEELAKGQKDKEMGQSFHCFYIFWSGIWS